MTRNFVYNKQELVLGQLRREILNGEHGVPGDPFKTVRGIAKEFGVAPVTAQRVVNRLKTEGFLQTRRKRLLIDSRHIVANRGATRRIGLLVTNVDNTFFSRLITAVELSGRRRSVEVVSAGSNYDCEHEKQQLAMLASSGADGFLIAPAHDERSAANLAELKLPFVLVGRVVKGTAADVVMVHDFEAGRLAARHLIEKRCRKFIYIGMSNYQYDKRFKGFAYELSGHQLGIAPEAIIRIDALSNDDPLTPELLRVLAAGGKTGVFCYHDLLAVRALRCARISHLNVPEEVAIVGMDDLPIAVEVYPSLTSIAYPLRQIADNALDILLRRIDRTVSGRGTANYLVPDLIVRESSQ